MGRSIAVDVSLCEVWGKSASQHHSIPDSVSRSLPAAAHSFYYASDVTCDVATRVPVPSVQLQPPDRHDFRDAVTGCSLWNNVWNNVPGNYLSFIFGAPPQPPVWIWCTSSSSKADWLNCWTGKKGYNFSFIIRVQWAGKKILILILLIFYWKYYIHKCKWTQPLSQDTTIQNIEHYIQSLHGLKNNSPKYILFFSRY